MTALRLIFVIACILLFFGLFGCKKQTNIEVGMPYYIKSYVFKNGDFQPIQPVIVTELYYNNGARRPFVKAKAKVDWSKFDRNYMGNKNLVMKEGDTTTLVWEFRQSDLEK